jgi:broad specificity phosphatase PhoE
VILLVRHARAGKRGTAGADDSLRPLDERGRRQAAALAAALSGRPLDRVISSPFVRCIETIEPLARAAGLTIELRDELAEGGSAADARGLIAELDGQEAALCSHGDVITELIGHHRQAKKGSVWILDPGHDLAPVSYLPPAG